MKKNIGLVREGHVPLYYQLQELLIEQIESGVYKPGDAIPSENQLVKMFDVSKNTVIQALTALEYKKLVHRVRGKGTYVSNNKITQDISTLLSYSAEIIGLKKKPTSTILSSNKIPASESIANKLGLKRDEPVYQIQRLREVDREPMALQTSFLPCEICDGLIDHPLTDDSLFKTLNDHYGIAVVSAKETLQTIKADRYESNLLHVKIDEPLFFVERSSYDTQGRIVEFVRTILRGDRYRFVLQLGKQDTTL